MRIHSAYSKLCEQRDVALRTVEYTFVIITPRSTNNPSVNSCKRLIYGENNVFFLIIIKELKSIEWEYVKPGKYEQTIDSWDNAVHPT